MRCRRLATALVALALPAAADAQLIAMGQTVAAELTMADAAFQNGAHYRIYAMTGQEGDAISIAVSSDHFDANVVLLDLAGNRIAADDDSDGACNALISTRLPETGDFQIVVFTGNPGTIGRFSLDLREGRSRADNETPCAGFVRPTGILPVGEVVNDALDESDPTLPDGSIFDAWLIPLPNDGPVTVDLESGRFDAHLTLMTPRGQPIAQNDNGAGACNARVVYPGGGGQIRALVRTRRGSGGYALTVRQGALPIDYRQACDQPPTTGRRVAGFSELDAGYRVMGVNGAYLGALTAADPVFAQDETRVQAWAIQGEQDQEVTIELVSSEFDPFLMVYGPELPAALSDDDGGGGCNARISFRLRTDQAYSVIVNHAGEVDAGNFEIYTSTDEPSTPMDETCAAGAPPVIEDLNGLAALEPKGTLTLGESITGSLEDPDALHSTGSYVEAWTIEGTVGQTATVTLRSEQMDAFLYLLGPGIQGALRDDDGAGGCDARITVTFPQTGAYRAVFTTVTEGATGTYRASLGSQPEPPKLAICSGDR